MEKGRKINTYHENPIDNILIEICNNVNKYFFKLNFTPNMITTLSLIVSLYSSYSIYNKQYELGSVLFLAAYFFDCLDGNYARTYNMTSKFGDLYDHASDMAKISILILCIMLLKIKKNTKILFIAIFCIFGLLAGVHIGCQEKMKEDTKKNKSKTLDITKCLCPNKNNIIYTRYFGTGTFNIIIFIFIFNLNYINKLL